MALSDRDKRTLRFGLIALGVLLVGYLMFSVLGGGEDALGPTGPVEPLPGGESPSPSATATPTAQPTAIFAGRDPFAIPSVLAGSPTGGGGGSQSASTSASHSPSPSDGAPSADDTATIGGRTVVLLDVFTRDGEERADIEVNAVVYHVSEGEQFGPGQSYELRSISGDCVVVLFGDESTRLCVDPQK